MRILSHQAKCPRAEGHGRSAPPGRKNAPGPADAHGLTDLARTGGPWRRFGPGGSGRALLAGFALVLALVAALSGCDRFSRAAPRARNGALDLTGLDLALQGPVALDGQWQVYWNRRLTPSDLADPARLSEKPEYFSLPGAWKRSAPKDRTSSGQDGQATFRLRVSVRPGDEKLMLRLFDIRDAYTLWVNGEVVASYRDKGEHSAPETPDVPLVLAEVNPQGPSLDVVLSLGGQGARQGVLTTPIRLGTPESFEREHLLVWGISLFIAGSVWIMGLYHLSLFFLNKNRLSYLYFSLLCFVWIGFFVSGHATQWVVSLFITNIDAELLYRLHLSFYLLTRPLGYRFLRTLYPQEFSRFFQHAADALPILFGPVVWLFPIGFVHRTISFSFLVTITVLLYCIWRLVVCIRMERDGARLILLGYGVIGFFGITTMLCHAGLLDTGFSLASGMLLQLGMLVYVLAQAQALGQRFSRAFRSVRDLSTTLERKNVALGQEMAERDRLERKLIQTSEEERRRLSHELHDGLCQTLIGARLHCSTLEDKVVDGPAATDLAHLSALLDASLGDAYTLSHGLWPVEHDPRIPGPSLDALVRRTAESTGVAIELHREFKCATCVNPHATTLYRIAQEALANAVKHARAGRIVVSLCCLGDRLILSVEDNGVGRGGAAPSQGGLGLDIMAHRARIIGARLEISDAPGGGTLVRCAAPCPGREAKTSDAGS